MPSALNQPLSSVGGEGKWEPFYYKTLEATIEQLVGDSGVVSRAICSHPYNCGQYYYIVKIEDAVNNSYRVEKFNASNDVIETIISASSNDANKYWDAFLFLGIKATISIDIGVSITIEDRSSGETNDEWKITLPSLSEMEKQKVWHGGYSTMVRLPHKLNTKTYTDIIPTNLKNKNISVCLNPPFQPRDESIGSYENGCLVQSISTETGIAHNYGLTVALMWAQDPDANITNIAMDSVYQEDSTEKWILGAMSHVDVNPTTFAGLLEDFPTLAQLPSGDSDTGGTTSTGAPQTINASIAGRAGAARFRIDFLDMAGDEVVCAYNQYWPLILTIS